MDRARPTPFSFSSQGQSVQSSPAIFQISSLIPAEVTVALGLVGFEHACNFRSGNACLAVFSVNDAHQQMAIWSPSILPSDFRHLQH
jgi:hypothetical protein